MPVFDDVETRVHWAHNEKTEVYRTNLYQLSESQHVCDVNRSKWNSPLYRRCIESLLFREFAENESRSARSIGSENEGDLRMKSAIHVLRVWRKFLVAPNITPSICIVLRFSVNDFELFRARAWTRLANNSDLNAHIPDIFSHIYWPPLKTNVRRTWI